MADYGIYQKLVDFAGAGATVPLTGFGNLLAKGAIKKAETDGLIGAFTGGTAAAAGGIAAAMADTHGFQGNHSDQRIAPGQS